MATRSSSGKKHIKLASVLGTIGFSVLLFLLIVAKQFAFLYSYDGLCQILLIIQWIVAILIVCCFVKSLIKLSKSIVKPSYTIILIFLLITILIFNIFIWFFIGSDGSQTGGYFSINEKYNKEHSYIISIKNDEESIKIPVDKQTYDSLIINKDIKYHIEYRTIRLYSKGVLENSIDTSKYIDSGN